MFPCFSYKNGVFHKWDPPFMDGLFHGKFENNMDDN